MSIEQSLERIAAALEAIASNKAIPADKPKADAKPAKPAEAKPAEAKPGPSPEAEALKKRALQLWATHSASIKKWCVDKGAPEGKIGNLDPQHHKALGEYLTSLEKPAESSDI